MEERQTRRRHDKAFKIDAVRLVMQEKRPVAEVSRDLGINANTLHRWVREQRDEGGNAFPGNGRLLPQDAELRRLKKELELVKEERDILKKAMAVFSRRP